LDIRLIMPPTMGGSISWLKIRSGTRAAPEVEQELLARNEYLAAENRTRKHETESDHRFA
jgi:hypothetical protein